MRTFLVALWMAILVAEVVHANVEYTESRVEDGSLEIVTASHVEDEPEKVDSKGFPKVHVPPGLPEDLRSWFQSLAVQQGLVKENLPPPHVYQVIEPQGSVGPSESANSSGPSLNDSTKLPFYFVVFKGPQGPRGERGVPGLPGLSGKEGKDGAPGLPGRPGFDGHPGFPGIKGNRGYPGPPGLQGPKGEAGYPGLPGFPGAEGAEGLPGFKGQKGEAGYPGLPGRPGAEGAEGLPGFPGQKGERGDGRVMGERGGFPGLPGLGFS